jgi:phytoene dehydrogenase-like protein
MKKEGNDFSADFIIIGSGLGGLCAAAYLSRANYRVIVLEKNAEIGGKCATRIIDGNRYVIGANTFGSRTAFILKELGINLDWISAPLRLHGEKGFVSFPAGFPTIGQLKNFGVNFFYFLTILNRFGKFILHPSSKIRTYRDVIEYLISVPAAQELLYSEAWYIGAHPEWLPSNSLKFFLGTYYGFNNPIYPLQGAQAIPYALADYIKAHNGKILTGQEVTEIIIEKEKAQGVQVKKQWFSAKYGVISNTELSRTIALLKSDSNLSQIQKMDLGQKSAFPFALLFLILDSSKAPSNIVKPTPLLETNATFFVRPVCDVIDELGSGNINGTPIFNLILSDTKAQLMNGSKLEHLPALVTTLWPKSSSPDINLCKLTQHILEKIDSRYTGFGKAVLSTQWVTPGEYENKFGFTSNPAPIIETPTYVKQSWKLPIPKLYNVGVTVLPSGSNTGTSIESGRNCAIDILNTITDY